MNNYPYIPFIPDKKQVMRRMGSLKADFEQGLEKEIDDYYTYAGAAFTVRGCAGTFELKRFGESAVEIAGQRVESRLLAKMLADSKEAYVMCATMLKKDVDKINEAISEGKGLKALVLDAYASEYTDGALDIIMQRKNEALRRTGRRLTSKRFSAGYGDLEIKYQKVFYDLLEMQKLDVEITGNYLLIPEKSVIAVAGVE